MIETIPRVGYRMRAPDIPPLLPRGSRWQVALIFLRAIFKTHRP